MQALDIMDGDTPLKEAGRMILRVNQAKSLFLRDTGKAAQQLLISNDLYWHLRRYMPSSMSTFENRRMMAGLEVLVVFNLQGYEGYIA